jgi:hypothetical protein
MKSEYLLVEGNYIVINVMQKLVASIKVIRYTLDWTTKFNYPTWSQEQRLQQKLFSCTV